MSTAADLAQPAASAGDHRTLVVFVRHPRPGAVKTRLAAAVGDAAAARLYRVLVESVLEATAPRGAEYERLVYYEPPEAAQAMRVWLPGTRLRRQAPGGLGARLADAFARAFARGAGRVAVAGSDVPGLSREEVTAAFAALDAADVVLGPAHDGGYYLVALRQPRPGLFEGISWSTPRVLDETLALARAAGLTVARLAPRQDVDTLDDLRSAWPLVSALPLPPELREVIERALAPKAAQ